MEKLDLRILQDLSTVAMTTMIKISQTHHCLEQVFIYCIESCLCGRLYADSSPRSHTETLSYLIHKTLSSI